MLQCERHAKPTWPGRNHCFQCDLSDAHRIIVEVCESFHHHPSRPTPIELSVLNRVAFHIAAQFTPQHTDKIEARSRRDQRMTELWPKIEAMNVNEAEELKKPLRALSCSVCGSFCQGRQWFNQDTGYGICASCAQFVKTHRPFNRDPIEPWEFTFSYGVEGINYNPSENR